MPNISLNAGDLAEPLRIEVDVENAHVPDAVQVVLNITNEGIILDMYDSEGACDPLYHSMWQEISGEIHISFEGDDSSGE